MNHPTAPRPRSRHATALAGAILLLACAPAPAGEVLVSETGGGKVRRYTTDCLLWTRQADFAAGTYAAEPLASPVGLARDTLGRVYVSEQRAGGRILRFQADGTFLDVVARSGVDFTGNPETLCAGPDGFIYISLAFGTSNNRILRLDPQSKQVTVFLASGLSTPRGLAFDSLGRLWIANRGSFSAADGYLSRYADGLLTTVDSALVRPSGLGFDDAAGTILSTQGTTQDIWSYDAAGTKTLLHDAAVANSLDVKRIEGHLCQTDYDSGKVRVVLATNSNYAVASGLTNPGHLLALHETPHDGPCAIPGVPALPGTTIAYSPPSSNIYLGSPALLRCPNGTLLASHDYFGAGSTQTTTGQTFLYRSNNDGTTWTPQGEIRTLTSPGPDDDGVFWNSLFRSGSTIYSMGAECSVGDLVIRESTDSGATWSAVTTTQGRLIASTDGRAQACGVLTESAYGRLWAGVEHALSGTFGDSRLTLLTADPSADLLQASSWVASNGLTRNTSWLGGTFRGWLEACPVPTPDGGMVVMARVDNRYANGAGIGMKAAVIRATTTVPPVLSFAGGDFDPNTPNSSGFVDFPGGTVRFIVRYDATSARYWSVCSYIPRAFRTNQYNAERFRGILALVSSADLRDWSVERIVAQDARLYSDDAATGASAFDGPYGSSSPKYYHTDSGLQYPFFLIEGDDVLVTIRTAWGDAEGGAAAGHDANYYQFLRVADFRRRSDPADFRLLCSGRSDPTHFAIRFQARPARLYRLESSSDLVRWTPTGATLESPGGPATFTVAMGPARTFYRVAETQSGWKP